MFVKYGRDRYGSYLSCASGRRDPDQHRWGGPPGPRPALVLLPLHPQSNSGSWWPDRPPPRCRPHPPARKPRRPRGLELEPRYPALPHPDRGPLPRPRAPARPGQKVSFLRPAVPGRITGTGRVVHRGGSTAFPAGELRDETGDVLATATATVRIIRPHRHW